MMSPIMRSCSTLLLGILSLASFSSGVAVSSRSIEASSINGRIKISGLAAKTCGIPGKLSVPKSPLMAAIGLLFFDQMDIFLFVKPPLVRVDVSARNPGKVLAALTETPRSLSELVLEPLRDEQYYEIREPFSLMSLVKSLMGLMVGFMVVVMFLMPKLAENMGNCDLHNN